MNRILKSLVALSMAFAFAGCTGAASSTASSTTVESSASESSEVVESTVEETTETVVYRIGMECDYAPNNWQEDTATDTNMPLANLDGFYGEGYDVQIAKLIGEQLGAEVEIVKLSWGGLIPALQEGQIDMIIAGMGDTPERKQSISFSETYSTHKTVYVMVVKSTSEYASATSIQDFGGATVLGQINTYYDSAIDQIEGVNHAPAAQDVPNMTAQLDEDLVDGLVLDDETADALYGDDSNYTILNFDDENGFVVEMTGACVGIRLEDTELVEAVNAALATIDQATRDQLMEEAKARQPK